MSKLAKLATAAVAALTGPAGMSLGLFAIGVWQADAGAQKGPPAPPAAALEERMGNRAAEPADSDPADCNPDMMSCLRETAGTLSLPMRETTPFLSGSSRPWGRAARIPHAGWRETTSRPCKGHGSGLRRLSEGCFFGIARPQDSLTGRSRCPVDSCFVFPGWSQLDLFGLHAVASAARFDCKGVDGCSRMAAKPGRPPGPVTHQ
jgi:hypothetical protein